ncbi:MAG: hypothetical protein IPJ09_17080 [Saprospiraceae bacterium]|nr:hypothetical protein [Saprospiraceae bacterium]
MIICPNDTMVACRSEVPVVDASQVMATDNCEEQMTSSICRPVYPVQMKARQMHLRALARLLSQ